MTDPGVMTLGDVAARFGVRTWQVRRLYQDGKLPPAARVGPYRVVTPAELPAVGEALRAAGYLKTEPERCGA